MLLTKYSADVLVVFEIITSASAITDRNVKMAVADAENVAYHFSDPYNISTIKHILVTDGAVRHKIFEQIGPISSTVR